MSEKWARPGRSGGNGTANPVDAIGGPLGGYVPPHSIEGELSVLGAMLLDREAIETATGILSAADFYRDGHQVLFEVFTTIYERDEPVDLVTVQEELKKRDKLEVIGGMAYLTSLLEAVPTISNVEYYSKIVEEKSIQRRLISAALEVVGLARGEVDDAVSLINQCQAVMMAVQGRAVGSGIHLTRAFEDHIEEAGEARQNPRPLIGQSTGLPSLDRITEGVKPGELTVVGADTSIGKSAYSLTVALNVAKASKPSDPKPVAVFSLEMRKERMTRRLLAMESGVSTWKQAHGMCTDADFTALHEAGERCFRAPLQVFDGIYTIEGIRSNLRRFVREHGHCSLCVVDYLQLMESTTKTDNREQEVAAFSKGLQRLAQEFNVPIMTGSQITISSSASPDKEPGLHQVRESRSIAHAADVVIFLHRERYLGDPATRPLSEPTQIIVAKNRDGETGRTTLAYLPRLTRFVEPTHDRQ